MEIKKRDGVSAEGMNVNGRHLCKRADNGHLVGGSVEGVRLDFPGGLEGHSGLSDLELNGREAQLAPGFHSFFPLPISLQNLC